MDPQLPRLGLIVPPRAGEVPVDGPLLYAGRADFVARGLGLGEISTRGYEEVIDRVLEQAVALARDGVSALSMMGTSLSFFRGAAFNEQLQRDLERATGLPCTTMSNAIVRGLQALGVRRVAAATAYIDEVNRQLERYLAAHGLEAVAVEGLAMTGVREVGLVSTATLVELCERVHARAPQAEGILISCGGLVTLDAVREVEARLGLPVVSSSPAGFWDLLRVAGLDSRSPGHGRLFEL